MEFIPYGIVVVMIAIALVYDLKSYKIPNRLTLPAILIGIAYHAFFGKGVSFALIGFAVGFIVFIIPYALRGMGGGDIKLMAAVGALIGGKGIFFVALATAIVGGVYAVGFLILKRKDAKTKECITNIKNTVLCMVLTQRPVAITPLETPNAPKLYYAIPISIGTVCFVGLKLAGLNFLNMI